MEEDAPKPSPITMILYVIDNGERNPSQNWEIIPKKKYIIGRSKKEVDLPLNIKLLSRKHAELIYYDSKTIMIKDLNSRNGTFINKVKIEPLKETFFTNKQKLSFGNTNNEIIFFDKSEQHKEDFALTDSEKSQKSESGKKIEINKENEKILKNENLEEINTDIKPDKRSEKNIPINNQRKERESEKGNEDKMNERERELINENNNYERYNKNSKEPSRQIELERDKNKQHSISNRDTFKNKREYSREREEYSSSYGRRSEKINLLNKNRKSHQISNKSDSRKANYSRSRSRSHSGSRETLVHQNNRVQKVENPQEKFPYNKENNSYDLERERLKREYDRGFANYERRQEEEEENFKRRERERNNYYDDERRRDYNRNNYFEEGNRILLRPEKLDIVMNQNYEDKRNNIMNKEDDMGFIKCYVFLFVVSLQFRHQPVQSSVYGEYIGSEWQCACPKAGVSFPLPAVQCLQFLSVFSVESHRLCFDVTQFAVLHANVSVAAQGDVVAFYLYDAMKHEAFVGQFRQHGLPQLRVGALSQHGAVAVVFQEGPHADAAQTQRHRLTLIEQGDDGRQ